MKTCKRALAILLSLCMMLSVMVFSAAAEDAAQPVSVQLGSVKAAELQSGDSETVLKLELAVTSADSAVTFDDFDPNAEIVIHEGLYTYAYGLMSEVISVSEKDVLEKSIIAKAKPVSYKDGILTVKVLSKDGKDGAKMVAISVEGLVDDMGLFIFDLPAGLLKNASGNTSAETSLQASVEGLTVKSLKLPVLINGILNDVVKGNVAGLIGKAALVLPFAFVIVPILLMTITTRANKIYKIYGINVHKVASDASRALFKVIPYLISGLL